MLCNRAGHGHGATEFCMEPQPGPGLENCCTPRGHGRGTPQGSWVPAGAGTFMDAQGGRFCSKELRGSLGPVTYSQLSDTAQV